MPAVPRPLLLSLLLISRLAAAASDCPTSAAKASYVEGRLLLRRGDGAGAVEKLLAARTDCPAPAVDFYLAMALESLGRLALARDALDKYLAAAGPAGNRSAVEAWAHDLSARAEAERQGIPPPVLPPHPLPTAPSPYFADEEAALTPPPPRPNPSQKGEDRWLFFGAAGLALNASFQPHSLSYQDGTVASYGASYQIGFAYRASLRIRLDIEALIAGQLLPWSRSDRANTTNVLFATLIGAGLRVDVPLLARGNTRLLLTPSAAIGLGSLSLNVDPSYVNGLGLRVALAITVERGALGLFIEPDLLILAAGDLEAAQWTTAIEIGGRVRF
jgi:hypothetical protein